MKSVWQFILSLLLVAVAIAILVEGAELLGLTTAAAVFRGAGQIIFGTLLSMTQGTSASTNSTA